MTTLSRRFAETAAFAAGVMIYIWWLQFVAPYSIGLLLLAMLISFWQHSETLISLGLGLWVFLRALRSWWIVWLLVIPATLWLAWDRLVVSGAIHRMLLYLLWCILQQLTYQKMVFDRLRAGLGDSWKTRTISGVIFATVHLPNPVLVLSTFVWGMFSSYLFERTPSILALGFVQFLLSSLLYLLTPVAWHHDFRVGPGYWEFH